MQKKNKKMEMRQTHPLGRGKYTTRQPIQIDSSITPLPDIKTAMEVLQNVPKVKAHLEEQELHASVWAGLALNYIKTKKNIPTNQQLSKYFSKKSISIPIAQINFNLRLFHIINSSKTLRIKKLPLQFFKKNIKFLESLIDKKMLL